MFPRQTTGSYVFRRREYSMWPGMRWQNNNTIYYYISYIDVNCVLTIHLPGCHVLCHRNACAYHTVSNSLAFLRGEERQSIIRTNWKQLLIIGAFVRFNLHQWSLVYLMFSLACWKWLHWMWNCCQKKLSRDKTRTGLEQRSSDTKHRKTTVS